ncbi:hypothetical protein KIKIMORA_00560 [Brevundimonas phage vB_BpoS-Kikimora]|uniref:Uncharacterized protein n=1 Tax=Brevundimonas phage vB_BpoS-Kikimora TaxID=2948601 RepID=A0A9E7SK62_9CAUD|nr:hypothetical protein KIKIMORA_00560 [Brevundimonas phage vB_BpoS-Kikimora]
MNSDMPSPEIPLHPNDPAFARDQPWARRAFRYPGLTEATKTMIANLRTGPAGESDAERAKRLEQQVNTLQAELAAKAELAERLTPLVDSLVGLLAPDQGQGLTRQERILFAVATAIQARLGDPAPPAARSLTGDGGHTIDSNRAWLARQLYDTRLSNEEAYGIVAYHPCISDQYEGDTAHD